MDIKTIATINMNDESTGDEIFAIIRTCDDKIILGVSIETNGDYEIAINTADCEKLIKHLTEAIKR